MIKKLIAVSITSALSFSALATTAESPINYNTVQAGIGFGSDLVALNIAFEKQYDDNWIFGGGYNRDMFDIYGADVTYSAFTGKALYRYSVSEEADIVAGGYVGFGMYDSSYSGFDLDDNSFLFGGEVGYRHALTSQIELGAKVHYTDIQKRRAEGVYSISHAHSCMSEWQTFTGNASCGYLKRTY
ncbi:outer membrane beta-barrel protein [Vibrio breoganii]